MEALLLSKKSSAKHKPEEIEAATILANKGYKVTRKDEAGEVKTPDGYLFTASFEQRTPTRASVKKALGHASEKMLILPLSMISLIYTTERM